MGTQRVQWELSEHADDTELIVSELAANAILHGEGQIGVRISYDGRNGTTTVGGSWITDTNEGRVWYTGSAAVRMETVTKFAIHSSGPIRAPRRA